MRIALLTASDPLDLRSWSGTPYHMLRGLEARGAEVVPLGPFRTPGRQLLRAYGRALRYFRGCNYQYGHSVAFSRSCSAAAAQALSGADFDVVLAPAASPCIAELSTDLPVLYLTDATFRLMIDYYPDFSRLCRTTLRDGELIESRALGMASAVVVPTEWVARSAELDYGVGRERLHVVPFGANLDPPPDREAAKTGRRRGPLDLLFIGKEWARKGGHVAVDALRALNAKGVDARLTICGCAPPPGFPVDHVRVVPSIDKNQPGWRGAMESLYASSDFLLLPARAECFGIVIAEANSHGVPALVSATGGLPEVVVDGRNGYVLPLSAGGEEYASTVLSVISDAERYERLCASSRLEFETRLNWDAWSDAVLRIAARLATSGK